MHRKTMRTSIFVALCITTLLSMAAIAFAGTIDFGVQKGDYYWQTSAHIYVVYDDDTYEVNTAASDATINNWIWFPGSYGPVDVALESVGPGRVEAWAAGQFNWIGSSFKAFSWAMSEPPSYSGQTGFY